MDIETEFLIINTRLAIHKKSKDCHINSKIIAEELKSLGFDVKVITGFYVNPPKLIKHSWIEFENKILETDCKQIREECDIIPNELCAV